MRHRSDCRGRNRNNCCICICICILLIQLLGCHIEINACFVFHATVIGKLMYCAPAWHGFWSASDYVRLDSFTRCYVGQSACTVTSWLCSWKPTTRCFVKYCTTKHTLFTHIYLTGQKLSTLFEPDLIKSLLYVKPCSDLNDRNFFRAVNEDCYLFFSIASFICLPVYIVYIVAFVNLFY